MWEFCPAWLVPDTKGFHSFPCVLRHLHLTGDVHGLATSHSTCNKTADHCANGETEALQKKLSQPLGEALRQQLGLNPFLS